MPDSVYSAPVIHTNGKAVAYFEPEVVSIGIALSQEFPTYTACFKEMAAAIATIKEKLYEIGMAQEKVWISYSDIDAVTKDLYESTGRHNRSFKKEVKEGYSYSAEIFAESPFDKDSYMDLWDMLTNLDYSFIEGLSISFCLEDVEDKRTELRGQAIADSKVKAQAAAKAYGFKLGKVLDISFEHAYRNRDRYDRSSLRTYGARSRYADAIFSSPEPIQVESSINVAWELVEV